MIVRLRSVLKCRIKAAKGFTLTEMLVTLLIMTLASTLLATGVPVAIDTYQKTVNSANAQMALSTTLTVLRSELGTSSDVRVVGDKIYYLAEEGYWASIENSSDATGNTRGLVKRYYLGEPSMGTPKAQVTGLGAAQADMCFPIVSDAAITEPLKVELEEPARSETDSTLTIKTLKVTDAGGNELASVANYKILLRFDT